MEVGGRRANGQGKGRSLGCHVQCSIVIFQWSFAVVGPFKGNWCEVEDKGIILLGGFSFGELGYSQLHSQLEVIKPSGLYQYRRLELHLFEWDPDPVLTLQPADVGFWGLSGLNQNDSSNGSASQAPFIYKSTGLRGFRTSLMLRRIYCELLTALKLELRR